MRKYNIVIIMIQNYTSGPSGLQNKQNVILMGKKFTHDAYWFENVAQ